MASTNSPENKEELQCVFPTFKGYMEMEDGTLKRLVGLMD
jgi:hypothetical protein